MSEFANQDYLKFLCRNNITIQDKVVLDVGCGITGFVSFANVHGASESWGVDYNSNLLNLTFQNEGVAKKDRNKYLHMPFSAIPERRPDLIGKFDIVKITAVTPYADAHELKRMACTAHQLLKKDGKVLIGLPQSSNLIGTLFTEDQPLDNLLGYHPHINDLPASVPVRTKSLQDAYRRLFKAYFGEVQEVLDDYRHPILIASSPKEKVPNVSDIRFNTETMTLSPLLSELKMPCNQNRYIGR